MFQENLSLYRGVYRLKHDIRFVEYVTRTELGMIGKNEYIVRFAPPKDKLLPETDKTPKE
ncbi:MAG: hypothetical protein HC887_09100 [Desulfobacteraceae bacterium]|nr:hypothetical protein [Desulfobacteraceae bacterium]